MKNIQRLVHLMREYEVVNAREKQALRAVGNAWEAGNGELAEQLLLDAAESLGKERGDLFERIIKLQRLLGAHSGKPQPHLV
jgi:hypothetical protein